MNAGALGAFIDGVFRGVDTRHGWEDRKAAAARQKKFDAMEEERFKREMEINDLRLRQATGDLAETERVRAAEAQRRQDMADAYAATEQSMQGLGAAPPAAPMPPDPSMSSSGPPAAPAAPTPAPAAPPRVAAAMGPGPTFETTGRSPGPVPVPPAMGAVPARPASPTAPTGPSFETTGRGPMPVANGAMTFTHDDGTVFEVIPDPDGGATFRTDRGAFRITKDQRVLREDGAEITDPSAKSLALDFARIAARPRAKAEAPQGRSAIGQAYDYMADSLRPDPNHQFFQPGGMVSDIAEGLNRLYQVPGKVNAAAADAISSGAQAVGDGARRLAAPVINYATGIDIAPAPAPAPAAPAAPPASLGAAPATPAPAPVQNPGAGMASLSQAWQQAVTPPAGTPPEVQQASQAAATAVQQAPDVAAAIATAPPEALGALANPGATEKQQEIGADDFIDHYMEVGAPMVLQRMLERGDIEGVQEFQAFLDEQKTRSGMKAWAKAAVAAKVGDMDTFAKEIVRAYNTLDYFGDDTVIVEEQSGFTYADDGTITGAILTFKDVNSGKTYQQTFDSPDDLVGLGIDMLAPEQAFEAYRQRAAAQQEAQLGAAKTAKEAEDEARRAADAANKQIIDLGKSIFEASQDAALTGGTPVTMEEAMAEARRLLSGQSSAAPPPPLYRPAP